MRAGSSGFHISDLFSDGKRAGRREFADQQSHMRCGGGGAGVVVAVAAISFPPKTRDPISCSDNKLCFSKYLA